MWFNVGLGQGACSRYDLKVTHTSDCTSSSAVWTECRQTNMSIHIGPLEMRVLITYGPHEPYSKPKCLRCLPTWMVVKIMVSFWVPRNIRCRNMIGIQKGTILLTTTPHTN